MALGKFVLQRLYHARRRDGAADKRDPHGIESSRRQGFGCKSGPKAVTIACDRGKSSNAFATHEGVDFRALNIRRAVVARAESCGVAGSGPGGCETLGEVLRVRAEIERPRGVSPQLPGRGRGLQAVEKPRLLCGAEDRLRRIALAEVGDLFVAEGDGIGRLAAGVKASRVEDLVDFLRHELGK